MLKHSSVLQKLEKHSDPFFSVDNTLMFYLFLCSTLSACSSGPKTKGITYIVVLCIDIQCILRLLISEDCVVILDGGKTQQSFVNPLTCCEVINSLVISLEKEHGPRNEHKAVVLQQLCNFLELNTKSWRI